MEEKKQAALAAIDANRETILQVSDQIWEFAELSLQEYRQEMAGIFTTCVSRDTLDEAPMAYKGMEEILSQIGPTAQVVAQIRPIYNFKAAD